MKVTGVLSIAGISSATSSTTHTKSTEPGLNTDLRSKTGPEAPEKSKALGHWVVGLPVTTVVDISAYLVLCR